MKGDNSWPTSFTSQVGTGSNWHVLFNAEPIIFSTSSCVTAVDWESVGVTLSGTSYSGAVAVKAQTLSLKYVANSSAVLLPVSSVTASPILRVVYATASVSCHCLPRLWCASNCYVWLHKIHAWPSACLPKLGKGFWKNF